MLEVYLGKLNWKKIAVALKQEEETSVASTITADTIVITENARSLKAVENEHSEVQFKKWKRG